MGPPCQMTHASLNPERRAVDHAAAHLSRAFARSREYPVLEFGILAVASPDRKFTGTSRFRRGQTIMTLVQAFWEILEPTPRRSRLGCSCLSRCSPRRGVSPVATYIRGYATQARCTGEGQYCSVCWRPILGSRLDRSVQQIRSLWSRLSYGRTVLCETRGLKPAAS